MKHIAVVHMLTFVVLPLCCRNVPETVYYKLFNDKRQAEKTIQVENSERLKQAVHILDQLDLSGYNRYGTGQRRSEGASVTISITVVTISRDHLAKYSPMYLTQVVANLLVLIKNYESTSRYLHINLSICNVDKHPANHTEALSLSRFLPMLTLALSPGPHYYAESHNSPHSYPGHAFYDNTQSLAVHNNQSVQQSHTHQGNHPNDPVHHSQNSLDNRCQTVLHRNNYHNHR